MESSIGPRKMCHDNNDDDCPSAAPAEPQQKKAKTVSSPQNAVESQIIVESKLLNAFAKMSKGRKLVYRVLGVMEINSEGCIYLLKNVIHNIAHYARPYPEDNISVFDEQFPNELRQMLLCRYDSFWGWDVELCELMFPNDQEAMQWYIESQMNKTHLEMKKKRRITIIIITIIIIIRIAFPM